MKAPLFDVTDFLKTEDDIAGYWDASLEDNDHRIVALAAQDIARARRRNAERAFGERLIRSVKEAADIVGGEADPSTYRVHHGGRVVTLQEFEDFIQDRDPGDENDSKVHERTTSRDH